MLEDNAKLGLDRTATPLELDEIFGSLNDLNIALGPDGANKADAGGVGPLTRLLDSTARNFGGQGVRVQQDPEELRRASPRPWPTTRTSCSARSPRSRSSPARWPRTTSTVRQFNDSLAGGADLLADEREELAAVLRT